MVASSKVLERSEEEEIGLKARWVPRNLDIPLSSSCTKSGEGRTSSSGLRRLSTRGRSESSYPKPAPPDGGLRTLHPLSLSLHSSFLLGWAVLSASRARYSNRVICLLGSVWSADSVMVSMVNPNADRHRGLENK